MAHYFVNSSGKITKTNKKKKTPDVAYSVSTDGKVTEQNIAPVKSSNTTEIAPITNKKEKGWAVEELLPTESIMSTIPKRKEPEIKTPASAVAQGILGTDISALTLDELKTKKTESKDMGERLQYASAYDSKIIEKNMEILASNKMDGANHSVLEELKLIAQIYKGEEKEKHKEAVLKKMEALGVDTKDYALYAGDKNFSWEGFGDWLGQAAMKGVAGFDKGMTATADVLLGKPLQALGWESNPISKMNDYYGDYYNTYAYNEQLARERLGGGAGLEFAGGAVEGTIGALPNAIMAMATMGASAATSGTQLAQNMAYNSGNILTKAGVTVQNMMKNPQYWMSFARTLGTDYEQAKGKGASDTKAYLGATLSSLINAGAEIGVDGASGIQGLPDKIAKGGGHAILDWVQSSFEEGSEEVLQGIVNNVVAKVLYDSETKIIDPKESVKEFALGTAVGGVLGGGQVITQSAINAGRTIAQEAEAKKLTDNEQKVINKEVENRIAEEEKDGTKLTNKEKKAIEDRVMKDFEKGYISTDTIESVLGGDTYRNYKSITNMEETFKDEIKRLENDPRPFAQNRVEEVRNQLKQLEESAKKAELKDLLSNKVEVLTRGSRLGESYREIERRSQRFEADLTKYDEKTKATIQRAIDSGILNNTNRTHEFVDMIAKLSTDKGVLFDFTNNENLKKSGFAIEGKTINGLVKDNDIILNIDSKKALNTVVGHEITHVLEGTELYSELQNAVKEYATTKGDYDARLQAISELYKDVDGANIEAELTADLIGDYLFTDSDFISKLSTEKPNIFKKIYEEIKYLVKIATAGSKEARQLEEVKRAFEKAYQRNTSNNNTRSDFQLEFTPKTDTDISYDSLVAKPDMVVSKITTDISEIDIENREKIALEAREKLVEKGLKGEDGAIRIHNKDTDTDIVIGLPGLRHGLDRNYEYTALVSMHLDSYLENAVKINEALPDENRKNESDIYLGYGETVNGEKVPAYFVVSKLTTGQTELVEFGSLYSIRAKKIVEDSAQSSPDFQFRTSTNISIAELLNDVNEIYSDVLPKTVAEHYGHGRKETKLGKSVKYSLSTEREAFPKTKNTMKPTTANLQKEMLTVRDVRNDTMRKHNYTESDVKQVNDFMDNMATFMEKAGVTYNYIGLEDVNNAKLKVVYDKNGNPQRVTMSAMVQNGDYPVNFDFTSICKKRQSMSMVIKELAKRQTSDGRRTLDTINLDAKALWTINEELRKAGLETACLGCFVEAKRYNIQNFADKATKMWNSIVDEVRMEQGYTSDAEYFNLAEGVDLDAVDYTEVENIFKAYAQEPGRTSPETRMRALIKNGGEMYQKYLQASDIMTPEGIEALKSLSTKKNNLYGIIQGVYGQAAPKEVMGFTPYNSEVALLPAKKNGKDMAKYIASIGGVRMQSFSDFVVANVYDYMQMVADLSARHLPAHAYTKEIAFAKIFGLTGIKINMSVMFDIDSNLPDEYAGLQFIPDPNGTENYNGMQGRFEYLVGDKKRSDAVYAETGERPYVQSIGYDEAVELQNTEGYSKNVGIIGVGFSDKHIEKMLDDNNIRYVIPYHASSLPAVIKGVTNIAKAKDYTDFQNTIIDGKKKAGLGGFDIYADVEKTKNPKQTANNYLNWVKAQDQNGTPIFEDFSGHDNYYKLLFDFDPYDVLTGEYSPQTEVQNIYKGYNPSEGLTSTAEIESIIDAEMNAQNEANKSRNEMLPGVVDNVLDQLGIEGDTVGFSLSDTEDVAPTKYGNFNIYAKDIRYNAPEKQSSIEDAPPAEVAPIAETANGADVTLDAEPIAKVLTEEPAPEKKKSRFWSQAAELTLDKGFVFENLSKKTKNRELEAKWNYIRYADSKAQDFIGEGAEGVKALSDIKKDVESAGLTQEVYEYVYHLHNIDRMSLEDRFENSQNKAVFGDSVTPDVSRKIVAELEAKYPEVKKFANEIYSVNNYLRNLLVEGGVISQETADLWAEMYPHYVPIRRAGEHGLNINVPLDTGRTGVNAPVKKATGGSADILPLFDTMAQRALQTYKAVAKNSFGVELKNALGTTIGTETADVDSVIDGLDQSEELLQKGQNGRKPTFTVFEGGEKVTFEITEDMYDALKPTNETLTYTNKVANTIGNLHRGVLTEYNPAFLASNIIKDVQDVLINSQHPAKTYGNFPKAIKEMAVKGKWYKEYLKNGGEQNSYFDKKTNTFAKDKSTFVKAVGMPLNAISTANNYIERLPRLAEYIASRESGRSIEVSMLDSARVTTNFAAGGDLTKFANRNGATFLNASVQGVMQQVRNVREAKMNGLKGWTQLAAKYAVAGLPAVLLNSLLWDDDEEYEELSDYVKQNYYVVAKYGDGKFVRIPKGRTLSIIQDALEQTINAATGNDEADLQSFLQLAVSNLAPNNPIEDNILAPIIQAKNNTTWYGGDLVPTRLQDLPAEEQFDESTDSISRWLGEKLNVSPYKINYLLDQYTGGVGDTVLPMLTPEAENGEDSLAGNLMAPIRDKFTTDSVLKNQNVSDFYDISDTLTTNAKASGATHEDILSNKYVNSVKEEIGKLYAEKREIQSSNMSDSEKYYLVREIQKKINALAEEALGEYDNVNKSSGKGTYYASVGDRQFRWDQKDTDKTGTWVKLTDKQIERQNEVTKSLGITKDEYWSNMRDEYEFAYDNPEKYSFFQENGIAYDDYKSADEDGKRALTWAYENPGKYTMSKAITDDYMTYYQYKGELSDIRADKDADGKTISGSAKQKKIDYINSLDLDYGQKIILYRSLFDGKEDKESYNREILDYLNGRTDLTTDEIIAILRELDFKVYDDGRVEW